MNHPLRRRSTRHSLDERLRGNRSRLAWIIVAVALAAPEARADVIYHAFDTPFRTVVDQLPGIANAGFTWVQISPPEKSHSGDEWYYRYQPIDHTKIEGPLGNGDDLRALIQAAHARHIKVIVDVVLNHMADEGNLASTLAYPRFSAADFHPKACINYADRTSVMRGWLGDHCNLPDLDTSSTHVRQEAKNYLSLLLGLGADGFRFDAAKHMEPEFFGEILAALPPEKFVYGEHSRRTPRTAPSSPPIPTSDISRSRTSSWCGRCSRHSGWAAICARSRTRSWFQSEEPCRASLR